jgi:hypothetical protein
MRRALLVATLAWCTACAVDFESPGTTSSRPVEQDTVAGTKAGLALRSTPCPESSARACVDVVFVAPSNAERPRVAELRLSLGSGLRFVSAHEGDAGEAADRTWSFSRVRTERCACF